MTVRARRRVSVVDEWWRAHRPAAPALFEKELAAAISMLEDLVVHGAVHTTVRGRPVYRMLLPQTAQHSYYSVDAAAARVTVHTVWGARRGRAPAL